MSSQNRGIEFQFCSSWKNWDEVDTFVLQFEDVTLLPEVAKLVGVDRVEIMCVDCSKTSVGFYLEDGSEKHFSFSSELVLDTV